ncbi:MAG TPA: hypothetical protein VMR19_00315 [Candidatus Saccharimonadales bacterium]|jgi:hypothetical protein|nr:hypothetical protein [Candidatus Saccharimonadales bacterium]
MENSLLTLIDSAASVLVVLPSKPYFDQVAAGLSLYLSIHDRKEASIFCPSPMMVGFNRLIGVNKISAELGSKNLEIKFAGYDATNIDKVSYDIDNGEFKLTVVPKAGLAAPQKEQVAVSYAGVSADLVILVGGANDSHFPILSSSELSSAKIMHIGTRVLDSKREIMSFAKPGATTSELVANLIKENGLIMDADTSTNLVMGIEEGSMNFTSSEATPETFETFAYLLRNGGQRMPKIKLSPIGFPPGAIPTKPFRVSVPQPMASGPAVQQMPITNPDPVAEHVENKEEIIENPPDDWLQPKIYKGTSVS